MKNSAAARIENEIAHGKKLSGAGAEGVWNWESPSGKRRAARRAEYLIQFSNAKQGDKVLELGCGTGLFTKKFYEATKADITAIDISEELLAEARLNIHGVTFTKANAMHLPFEDSSFAAAYGSSVLHHLEFNPVLEEIYRVLKPGGIMVFAEPNMLNPQIFLQKNIPFIKKWMGDSPDETAIVRWKFSSLMKSKGFKNVKLFPYDFLHPIVPAALAGFVENTGKLVEKIPLLKEIAGSVIIVGEK